MTHMCLAASTWNPFKGCTFDCSYCGPSFRAQAKRQKHRCDRCYRYEPHTHPERLASIPRAEIVLVGGNGDISLCDPAYVAEILCTIKQSGRSSTFYLQSKRPEFFHQFVDRLPANVILVTTLETNRDGGYAAVSKAPVPSDRYRQFKALNYPRKVVTRDTRKLHKTKTTQLDGDAVEAIIARLPEYSPGGRRGRRFAVKTPIVVAWETALRPATLEALRAPENFVKGNPTLLIDDEIDKARFGRELPLTDRARAALDSECLEVGLIF
jgi:hypothetical protein